MNKWDERFLGLAEYISKWSKDTSTKVGAVIVDQQNRVISVGYNGLPRLVKDTDERLNNRELKYKLIQHAERNAIAFAKCDLTGCTIYTWPFMPCASCCGLLIQVGIRRIVAPSSSNPRWQDDFNLTRELCLEAGIILDETH